MDQQISDYDKYGYDYEEYWRDPKINRSYENQAEKSALSKLLPFEDRLPNQEKSWFCDLGAGFGRLFDVYRDRYHNIILTDYSLDNLKKAKEQNQKSNSEDPAPNIYYVAANAYSLPFKPESIDCLMTVRMLHHMEESQKVVNQIRNVLKSKGYLVLEYANKKHFIEVLRGLVGKSNMKPFSIEPYRRGEDLFFNFHPKYINKTLRAGFRIIKTISVSNLRSGFMKKIIPVGVMLFIDDLFQTFFNFMKFGPSIFVLAQKKEHPVAENEQPNTNSQEIDTILQCPHCGSAELIFLKNEVRCKGCDMRYQIVDGIYDFRV